MPESPRVSVFIASYNHAQFLPECLDSILTQTFQDFEIVVVDDGSTDGSHEILIDYQQRFPEKILYYWHPGQVNKGISASCNLAISKARGEYLAWIGSDDAWYPEKLVQQVALLDNHPRYGLVYSYAHFIDESGNRITGLAGVDVTHDTNPLGRIIQSCHTPAQTLVIRRDCLEDVGVFDENLVYSDWELMIRIFACWEVGFIGSPLAKYRLHTTNISKGIDPKINLQRILAMFQTIRDKANYIGGTLLLPRNQAFLSLQLAFHHYCVGNLEEAKNNLSRAFEEDPSLSQDVNYFNDWLNSWKPEYYNTSHGHFGFWVIANLPPQIIIPFRDKLLELQFNHPDTKEFFIRRGIEWGSAQKYPNGVTEIFSDFPVCIPLPRVWKDQVLREVFPTLLFKSYKVGDISKVRQYWVKTIQSNPSWLRNRGIWSVGLNAFLRPGKVSKLSREA